MERAKEYLEQTKEYIKQSKECTEEIKECIKQTGASREYKPPPRPNYSNMVYGCNNKNAKFKLSLVFIPLPTLSEYFIEICP